MTDNLGKTQVKSTGIAGMLHRAPVRNGSIGRLLAWLAATSDPHRVETLSMALVAAASKNGRARRFTFSGKLLIGHKGVEPSELSKGSTQVIRAILKIRPCRKESKDE